MDYFEENKENLQEEDDPHKISFSYDPYYEDTEDMTYVNTKKNGKEIEEDKTDILGPHFLVLSESVRKPENHPSSYSLTRRQGLMDGIVGVLGTLRKD